MPKTVSALRNISLSQLSLLIPIFVAVLIGCLWAFFRVYIVINIIDVVGWYRLAIPFAGFLGIVFGILGFKNTENTTPKLKLNAFSLIGILLNIALLYSMQIVDVPKIAGTITNIYTNDKNKNEPDLLVYLDLSFSNFPDDFFGNPSEPVLVVHVSKDTIIYKEIGYWSWQKEIVSIDQFQEKQYLEVKYDGMIFLTKPGQIYATEIIILKR